MWRHRWGYTAQYFKYTERNEAKQQNTDKVQTVKTAHTCLHRSIKSFITEKHAYENVVEDYQLFSNGSLWYIALNNKATGCYKNKQSEKQAWLRQFIIVATRQWPYVSQLYSISCY